MNSAESANQRSKYVCVSLQLTAKRQEMLNCNLAGISRHRDEWFVGMGAVIEA
jgi:hypothetical protein